MMKIFLKKVIFVNKAPFDRLELDFSENEIGVLSAVNGKGKTTILSYIADSFYEMARLSFPSEFEGKEDKLYRVSSSIYNLQFAEPSFVYLRFEVKDQSITEQIDYVEIRNNFTKEQYDKAVNLPNKISFQQLKSMWSGNFVKIISKNSSNQKQIEKLFQNNLLTYFPSYRYEKPGYLNDPYTVKLDFGITSKFSGYLKNPIEVVTGLSQLANWIMDVVLDLKSYKVTELIVLDQRSGKPAAHRQIVPGVGPENIIWNNLNKTITKILTSKNYGNIRFGIGPRHSGIQRIGIYRDVLKQGNQVTEQIYPNIFNLSSGESSLLCLFGELLRQADNNKSNIKLSEITGVVLIDEIDKHLHIKLQKEVLPQLFGMFPHVQFITSAHSPFVSMGLSEAMKQRSNIIDLDNFGISQDPKNNAQYTEVYNMMTSENERFKNLYQSLEQKIKNGEKPLIITEGKTDVKHIKKAKEKLNIIDCDLEFYEDNRDRGHSELEKILKYWSKLPHERKIIGIFDRDNKDIIRYVEENNQPYKVYGNNTFAFCLPIPQSREGYANISIELYYSDEEIKREKDGKRLYFDNEVYFEQSASDKKDRKLHRFEEPKKDKEFEKKILDEKVDGLDWIHSKSAFAQLIEENKDFISGFKFDNFRLIFNKIKEIVGS